MHGSSAAVQAEKGDTVNIEMALPGGVRDLCACLHTAGYQTVVAGGAVRDRLLGVPPHDWDVATAATPADVRVPPTL